MAFSVHSTVLAATAARTLAAFLILYHFYYYRRHYSNEYQRYDDSSEISSQPCEHKITPLSFYLYIALECRSLMILLNEKHIAHECKYQSCCDNTDYV